MTDSDRTIQILELSDKTLLEICRAADVIACECPGYLARIIRQVRAFQHYTASCIEQFPADAETHRWLADRSRQAEDILFQTLIELMQKEQLVNESMHLSLDKLSDRARAIVRGEVENLP